jgi:hypothetical protein
METNIALTIWQIYWMIAFSWVSGIFFSICMYYGIKHIIKCIQYEEQLQQERIDRHV